MKSPKVNLSKTADCFILLAKELHPSESPDLVNIENGNVMKMVKNLCIRRQGLCSWMTLPAYPRVVQPCQGVTHINIILNNNTRMQIRSQPCQCPVCSVHPIFGSLHMGALLGRPWLRCSLCHWLLRRWRRGYYWRRLKQWQRSEKINQFKKTLANYQIPQNAMLSSG